MERAIEYYEGALAIAREIGHRYGEATRSGYLGVAYGELGQAERAREYLERSVSIYEEIQSPYADWARERLAELEGEQ